MELNEIKAAVDTGQPVHWSNPGYTVVRGRGGYLIGWMVGSGRRDENYIGLTHADGVTLNGRPDEFFRGAPA